ncbi:MAG TPA: DUF1269 domain-containing protein [Actinobacteria bacterium]|nr:DUF1269 domain-containing protein [Actinomycetota bacterium]
MSELIVIGYDDEVTAGRVLDELQELQREYLVDLDDAAVLVRNLRGKVKVTTTDHSVSAGALSGMFWGTLIGLIFLVPVVGLVYGGLIGAAAGGINRLDIKEEFKKQIGAMVQPGTSAILAVVRHAAPEKVIESLEPYGGKVLRTSLSPEAEERLMDELHGEERRRGAA